MMNIAQYLDSTYLKTPEQSGISEEETLQIVKNLAQEAIDYHILAVMIRPDYVAEIKNLLTENNSNVVVGTVIGFHEGTYSVDEKLAEATQAINDGADELDFVINYEAYLNGNVELVKDEFLRCTQLCIQHQKIAKWIIEIAALTDEQIADITKNISTWAEENFDEKDLENIFVKSSTGFFQTENGKPNGATFEGIKIMLDNAGKLPVKAAGGVRTPEDAEKMIKLGVKRIGTSSAVALIKNNSSSEGY
ncbi:deoxyribose-phosphate aldolase [Chryseobacterium sp. Ch-15]|uniref:Deoxyribose-phosphate aldolase n=1 Tax=Chryseobacterium muglaense TaxID=2893752 RepID=A0A9Q3UW81_9FLAO|nr:deoxyribose-phosphate aldolase [Chryseobacterium muglaense]MBD3904921.1 deoxyribose-phosphate aldolase [Chryseobacterium muglaense]MCC9034469.1 deoxyribose-phosphate aldolase [Chryseobacterium muglaense]MCM2554576.1 deoxyribose-phosphate aldolase [Chryseobacterium muglaense]